MLNSEQLRIARGAAERTAARATSSPENERGQSPAAKQPGGNGSAAQSSPVVEGAGGRDAAGTGETPENEPARTSPPMQTTVRESGPAARGREAVDPPEAARPTFDILRVEPDGSTVIAGRAGPDIMVELIENDAVIGSDRTGAGGEFVILLAQPLAPGTHELRLRSTAPDASILSDETAIVSVPADGEGDELLALVETPDEPSRLIDIPAGPGSPEIGAGSDRREATDGGRRPAASDGEPSEARDVLMPPAPAIAGTSDAAQDGAPAALPRQIAAFVANSRRFAVDLRRAAREAGERDTAIGSNEALSAQARTLVDEGRSLLEAVTLPENRPVDASALNELVQRSTQIAADLAGSAEAGTIEVAMAADAANDIEAMADETASRTMALADAFASAAAEFAAAEATTALPALPRDGRTAVPEPTQSLPAESGGQADGASPLVVEAVEIERGTVYVAGTAEPGSKVRIYLDNQFLAENVVATGDRFLVSKQADVSTGMHMVRADQLGPSGDVTRRAEVPFFRPPGAAMSAISPLADTAAGGPDVVSNDVAMLPAGTGRDDTAGTPSNGPRQAAAGGLPLAGAMSPEDDATPAEQAVAGNGASAAPGARDASSDRSPVAAAERTSPDRSAAGDPDSAAVAFADGEGAMGAAPNAGQPASSQPSQPSQQGVTADGGEAADRRYGETASSSGAASPGGGAETERADAIAAAGTLTGSGDPASRGDAGAIAVTRQPALEPAEARVIIRKGDTLWEISRDTYGRGSRYSVIYLANGDQIRNPHRIYPGQVFRLPDEMNEGTQADARLN